MNGQCSGGTSYQSSTSVSIGRLHGALFANQQYYQDHGQNQERDNSKNDGKWDGDHPVIERTQPSIVGGRLTDDLKSFQAPSARASMMFSLPTPDSTLQMTKNSTRNESRPAMPGVWRSGSDRC